MSPATTPHPLTNHDWGQEPEPSIRLSLKSQRPCSDRTLGSPARSHRCTSTWLTCASQGWGLLAGCGAHQAPALSHAGVCSAGTCAMRVVGAAERAIPPLAPHFPIRPDVSQHVLLWVPAKSPGLLPAGGVSAGIPRRPGGYTPLPSVGLEAAS